MREPLTSLLIRETRILARDFARVSRGCDAIASALREHLQPEIERARIAPTKGGSGSETVVDPSTTRSQPSLDFGSGSVEDYD